MLIMKKAFIIYFEDKSAVVTTATDAHSALSQLDSSKLDKVSRVDLIPYPLL